MSSTPTTTGPIPAPTNTVNPLPATPAEAAAGVGPAASGTALDLHTQTEDAAKEYKNAQKAEKAYAQKKKCMTARKEWYDCKVHFAAGVQGFREGGKCVGRVVKAGPALAMEKVKGGKGQGVKTVDSGASGESIMVEKENANKKSGNGGVKAKAKTDEKTAIATPTASGAVAATPAAEATPVVHVPVVPVAPVAATPVPSPTQTKQEKKRMTLDQRIQQEEAKALARQEAEASAAHATAATGETPVVAPIPAPAPPQGLTPIQTTHTSASLANPPQLPPKTQLSPPGSPTKGTMEPIHEDGETGALPLASGVQGPVETQNPG
ncbi:uncharacterized protein EAF02_005199 [Botrytis sinoallii]|uniref:uncharacterized protein n=1 Tax=Botrytis sinoallii TaxID=1463999 RepID=UPI001902806E|nr:uncharacterized protein EAF02_005199 [Botrytis sinoallii]KAF7883279.1 hypothetical protein EAF02_005199 [Botrytis sinoallii]